MFLDFSKGIISSGVILSSMVSFASSASAQSDLDTSEEISFGLGENSIYKAKDEEAAPFFEDVQSAAKNETQQVEENGKDLDSKDGIYKAENGEAVPSLEDIQNSDEGETLPARESNGEIGSGDSLNVDPSSTKFAKLKKMGKNVVEKIKKLSPTDFALGTVAAAGVGSSIYLKNKNNNLEKVNKGKDLEIFDLNDSKKANESSADSLQKQLSLEKENLNKLKEEKDKEINDLKDELSSERDKCNKLQEALDNNSKWGLGTWLLIILGGYLGYVVLYTLVGSGVYLYKEDIKDVNQVLRAGANRAVDAATFSLCRDLYSDDL